LPWTILAISPTLLSKTPSVFGLVIIRAATSSVMASATTCGSRMPLGPLLSSRTLKPLSALEAGLVPWALSGTSTVWRGLPWARCQARTIIRPVSAPWAPAAGCRGQAANPETSESIRSSRYISSSAPWTRSSGSSGCTQAKPGRRAAASADFGLYFIVQEPSG